MKINVGIILILFSVFISISTIMGLMIWYFIFHRFKHIVLVLRPTVGTPRVQISKCRDYTDDKNGVKYWAHRFWKDKTTKYMPIPPDQCIVPTNKGKNFAMCFLTETGEYHFVKPDFPVVLQHYLALTKEVPEEILNVQDVNEREKMYSTWKAKIKADFDLATKDKLFISFKPYTTNHRIMQVSEEHKAIERRKKGGLRELLPILIPAAVVFMLVIVIIMGLIFWKDLTEPAIAKQAEITAQVQAQTEQWRIIERISNDVTDIKTQLGTPTADKVAPQ